LPRHVLTARDLHGLPAGSEISVPHDSLITPLAVEEAERLAIRIRLVEPGASAGLTIALACDHGGFELKEQLKSWISSLGHNTLDFGTDSASSVDYPDFAEKVALAVNRGHAARGIVIDSAGIGSSIAANKVHGIRAALCYDAATARNSREHNDANVLSLGAKMISHDLAREIVSIFLDTPFAGGRHQRRIDKILAIEARYGK
jgi:ribose 5-phosphate isomerase B